MIKKLKEHYKIAVAIVIVTLIIVSSFGSAYYEKSSEKISTNKIESQITYPVEFGKNQRDNKDDIMYVEKSGTDWWIAKWRDQSGSTYTLTEGGPAYPSHFTSNGDWDEDGKDDYILVFNQGTTQSNIFLYENDGGSVYWTYQPRILFIDFGDWDGDGKDEIMYVEKSGTDWWIAKWRDQSGSTYTLTEGGPAYPSHFTSNGDWDGDGKDDYILVFNQGTTQSNIFLYEADGGVSYWTNQPRILFIDFGDWDSVDVKDEIMYVEKSGTDWWIAKWRDQSGSTYTLTEGGPAYPSHFTSNGDWDGDGKDDYILVFNQGTTQSNIFLYENDGGSVYWTYQPRILFIDFGEWDTPPNTPSNPSPANHATGVSVTAVLSWTGGDPDPGDTVTYDVYFGTSSSPPKVVSNQSSTSYDPPGLMNYNTKYYWKIVAWDNHGASTTGPIWDFTTQEAPNNPPYTPSNPSPADGATGVSINADLGWNGGDPDSGDTVTYDVYFGTSSNPPYYGTTPSYPGSQTSITYSLPTLNPNTHYYWKIVAEDNHGETKTGPIWDFTTTSGIVPPTVQTNAATNVGTTSARLNGKIINDGGEACQIRFRYRVKGSSTWTYPSSWHGSYNSGQTFYEDISGLSPSTTYEFQAGAKNSAGEVWGGTLEFTTGNEPFYFIHITDPHVEKLYPGVNDIWQDDLQKIILMNPQPDFVICTGDLVDFGNGGDSEDAWNELTDDLYKLNGIFYIDSNHFIPIFFCPGNHDARYVGQCIPPYSFENYYNYIQPDYRTFFHKNCAIFSLNSGWDIWPFPPGGPIGDIWIPEGEGLRDMYGNEITNLQNDLSDLEDNYNVRIILTHHPYTTGGENDGVFWYGRPEFLQACNQYSIDMLFCGHIHNLGGITNFGTQPTKQIITNAIIYSNNFRKITVDPNLGTYSIGNMESFSSVLGGNINCNTNINIYDEMGNHNGINNSTGNIEVQIPLSYYSNWRLENDSLGINATNTMFLLPKNENKNYSFIIEGLSNESMNITLSTSLIGGQWSEVKYLNVSMYEDSIAYFYANESIYNYTINIKDPDQSTRIITPSIFEDNLPPEINIVVGEKNGSPGIKYSYTANASDSNDNNIYYLFDWGDGTNSNWLGPYESEQVIIASHIWNTEGSYEIKVKSKDDYGLEGNWSEPLQIEIKMPFACLLGVIENIQETDNFTYFNAVAVLLLSSNPPYFAFYHSYELMAVKNDYENGKIFENVSLFGETFNFVIGRFNAAAISQSASSSENQFHKYPLKPSVIFRRILLSLLNQRITH